MPDQNYFVRIRGKVSGPFDVATLQKLVQRGILSRANEISPDRVSWSRASDFEELFPSAEAVLAVRRAVVPSEEMPVAARRASPSAAPQEQAALYECSVCSGWSTANDVYADRSSRTGYICRECHSSNGALAAAARAAQYVPSRTTHDNPSGGKAGTVILIVAIVGIFLIGGGVLDYLRQPVKRPMGTANGSTPAAAGANPLLSLFSPSTQTITGAMWLQHKNGDTTIQRGQKISLLKHDVSGSDYLQAFHATIEQLKTKAESNPDENGEVNKAVAEYNRLVAKCNSDPNFSIDVADAYASLREVEDLPDWSNILAANTIVSATTDIDGKYQFTNVAPGKYFAHCLIVVDTFAVEWIAPVEVGTSPVKLDLYNDNAVRIVNFDD